jgi:DNA (cytosine-5)-methyltransferase 1
MHGKLSQAYIDLIIDAAPDFFLFENVKGLWSTARHREYYNELKTALHEAGYSTAERLCNALEFGVPQDRERVLMFGVKSELLPEGVAASGEILAFPWKRFTVYDAEEVKGLTWNSANDFGASVESTVDSRFCPLTVQYWFDKNDVESHPNQSAHFTPRNGIVKMRVVQEGDVSKKSYKRLHRYRYSPTAAYGNNEVHLHPTKARRISAAEAMAIQSLPKEFELPPEMTLSDMFKTIGNGVPFELSSGIAKTVKSFLEESIEKP